MDVLSPSQPSSHATAASQAKGHEWTRNTVCLNSSSGSISRTFNGQCGTVLPFRRMLHNGAASTAADKFCMFPNKVLKRVFGLNYDREENFTRMEN